MSYEFEIRKGYDLIYQSGIQMYSTWFNYVLFTWRWWVQVAFTIIPWIVWGVFKRRQSTDRLLYSGFFYDALFSNKPITRE